MLFSKYHIVIFRENEGHCKKLFLRGWLCVLALGIFLTVAAGNVVFWKYYTSYQKLSQEFAAAEKTVEEQNNQILSMANKLKNVQNDRYTAQQKSAYYNELILSTEKKIETAQNLLDALTVQRGGLGCVLLCLALFREGFLHAGLPLG